MPIYANGEEHADEFAFLASQFKVDAKDSAEFTDVPGVGVVPNKTKVPDVLAGIIKPTSDLLMAPGRAFKGELTPDEITDSGIGLGLTVAGMSSPFPKPGLGMFGGRVPPWVKTDAEFMEAQGFSARAIKRETGLERGAEGMWRREFSDNNAFWYPDKFKKVEDDIAVPDEVRAAKLGSVLDHTQLYEAYPEAKDIIVLETDRVGGKDSTMARFSPAKEGTPPIIEIKRGMSKNDTIESILHEVQHFIQAKEGFNYAAPHQIPKELQDQYMGWFIREGGQPALNKLEDLKAAGKTEEAQAQAQAIINSAKHKMYEGLSSEVEARNTEARRLMTPEQRKNSLGSDTEDYERGIQIVKVPNKNPQLGSSYK